MEEKPLILVTNDDGFDAPGIEALAEAMAEIGDVYTVAPDSERSASGHSGIDWGPLSVGDQDDASDGKQDSSGGLETNTAHSLNIKERPRPTRVQNEGQVYRVNGTPADCVYLAVVLSEPLPRRPDLIVSGINLGPNLGDDVYRSGTVAGAREGAFRDIPAIAFSLAVDRAGRLDFLSKKPDFSHAAEFAQELALHVLHSDIGERTYLNVNVPQGRPIPPAVVTVLGPRLQDGWLIDGAAVDMKRISVTPLQTDATNHDLLEELAEGLPGRGVVSRAAEKS